MKRIFAFARLSAFLERGCHPREGGDLLETFKVRLSRGGFLSISNDLEINLFEIVLGIMAIGLASIYPC